MFIRALAILLRFGLSVAEESIAFTGRKPPSDSPSDEPRSSSVSSSTSSEFEEELARFIYKDSSASFSSS